MNLGKKELGHWRAVISTESGTEVVRMILSAAGVFSQSGSDKAEVQFFAEGRRSVGLEVIRCVVEAADERTLANLLVRSAKQPKAKKKGKVNDADPNETTDPEE